MNGAAPPNMAYLMTALQPGYEEYDTTQCATTLSVPEEGAPQMQDLFAGEASFAAAAVGLNSADESLPYNTAELNAPEYSTDDFRMFSFKVARCSKRYVHDWRACPFAHPTENARRRDPRLHKYLPVPCPEYKRGICFRGDSCPYSHGVYECWLHPAKYRTQLCKEGPHCRRPVCFFAHSVLDLRQPTHVWDGNNYEPQTAAAALMQATAVAGPAGAQPTASRSSSDGAFSSMLQQQQLQQSSSAAEEALNNANAAGEGGGSGGSSSGGGGMGPSSPHGSQAGRSDSPAKTNSGNWSPATMGFDGAAQAAEPSPTTPPRALLDPPARPSGGSAAAALAAAAPGPPGSAEATAAATLAAALADLQAQQRGLAAARQGAALPRHSIDVGALAASSSSRGGGLGGPGASPSAAQQLLQQQQQARASVDLGQASSSPVTAAQLGAAGALQGRMSLDSLMATRNAGAQVPWASNLAGVPELAQSGHGPRMSNAVARKLGLAPQRTANEARLAKLRGVGQGGLATPPRTSLDGLLQALHGSQRASLEQQMVSQQMLAAAGLAQMNGGYMVPPGFPQQPGSYPGAMPDPSGMSINPALLNMVAAQMGGAVPAPMPGPGQGMAQPNAAAMAALVDSLNGWSLNGAQPAGYHAGPGAMPHRAASFDGAMSAHAAMMAQQGTPATSPYYLPAELENLMNNNGGRGEGLVNPVAAGHSGRGRE